LFNFI
jgi:hypothetical protein